MFTSAIMLQIDSCVRLLRRTDLVEVFKKPVKFCWRSRSASRKTFFCSSSVFLLRQQKARIKVKEKEVTLECAIKDKEGVAGWQPNAHKTSARAGWRTCRKQNRKYM